MARLGLEREIIDAEARRRSIGRLREAGVVLPTLAQLADPATIPAGISDALADVDPDVAHPLNLFRVHWYNRGDDRRRRATVPDHMVLGEAITGIPSPIIVLLGDRFPMIRAHKVLAAYGCLVPRLVSGQFDATRHRAIWPSTGNYCRGGVAISRVLGCRGVAVLPAGMSEERFSWLEAWIGQQGDIVRTPGTESNVKEIYDKCAELDADPENLIFNQFCEFGNHLVHYLCTGEAATRAFEHQARAHQGLRLAAFVSATGSAGTIGAGDRLKDAYGTKIVAVEALECPTMLYNGYGEHNIQGIGDKHIPLIHNVTNTDVAVAVSDVSTDSLFLLFQTEAGQAELAARGIDEEGRAALRELGLSGICNVLAAIKTAKTLGLGADDAIVTVATDGAAMYGSEIAKIRGKRFLSGFDRDAAARVYERHLPGLDLDHTLVLGPRERDRIFNLGYYTWVEQQGVSLEEFDRRRSQDFWVGLRELLPVWDAMIEAVNQEIGAKSA
ncbi:MAG: pyridoxal-phosphate dependent enzyme [Myxococcales bacterium]|nr:pyridoxal-phosphate dependent enzyme [Myxococcales bacterium]MCB9704105.1 pyridoxal-phosphate dependent enzyme [Myxococcales bacterium]